MKRWHINSKNGVVGECNAAPGNCPFGGASGSANHFGTQEEAQKAFEAMNSHKNTTTLKKSSSAKYETKIPDYVYTYTPSKIMAENVKEGDTLKGRKVTSVRKGPKNVSITHADPATGEEKTSYRPRKATVQVSTKGITRESEEAVKAATLEYGRERFLKDYKPARAEALGRIQARVDGGNDVTPELFEALLKAEARDGVHEVYRINVESKKKDSPEAPYSGAYSDYKEVIQQKMLDASSSTASRSTNEMVNLSDRAKLAAEADFVRHMDKGGFGFWS